MPKFGLAAVGIGHAAGEVGIRERGIEADGVGVVGDPPWPARRWAT